MAQRKRENDYQTLIWVVLDLAGIILSAFIFPLWRNILIGIAVIIAILLIIRFYWKRKK